MKGHFCQLIANKTQFSDQNFLNCKTKCSAFKKLQLKILFCTAAVDLIQDTVVQHMIICALNPFLKKKTDLKGNQTFNQFVAPGI